MELLKFFSKPTNEPLSLPVGSFTVSREGSIVVGTISSAYPPAELQAIARIVLAAFREAARAHLPCSELIIEYSSLKITARELRGGAVVFLAPAVARPISDPK